MPNETDGTTLGVRLPNPILPDTSMPRARHATLLLAALALGACEGPPDPILIGATMSQSGAYATQGIPARNGYLLCAADLNEEGGLLGRHVEFMIPDDESDTGRAVELYRQLVEEVGVEAVMGPYGSTLTAAVAPVTEEYGTVQVSPLAATSSIWDQGYRYLFMVLPPAELFLAGVVEIAAEAGVDRVAILQEDALFPRAAGAGAAQVAAEREMEVVLHESYPSGTSDFTPFLREAREMGAGAVAMAASTLSDFVKVREAMLEMGWEPIFGTSGVVREFQEALGDRADGVLGLSAWEPGLPYPGADSFVARYTGSFGEPPSFHAAGAYGACMVFAEGIRRAGSLDQEAIREALLGVEMTTIFGPWAVDERGYQLAHQGLIVQWQEGERVVVWPGEMAGGEPILP